MNKNAIEKIKEKLENAPSKNIDLYLTSIEELYDFNNFGSQDRKSLNSDIYEYLLQKTKEIKINYRIQITIHLEKSSENDLEVAQQVIHNCYHQKAKIQFNDSRKNSSHWRIRFLRAILFLIICNILSFFLSNYLDSQFTSLVSQSFEIMGWVALWEPVLYFLYTKKEETYELTDFLQLEYSKINIEKKLQ